MANKSNLSGCLNILNRNGLAWYVDKYTIPASLHHVLSEKDTPIYPFPLGMIGVYTRLFDYCNYCLPLTTFLIDVLLFHEVHLSQVNPFGLVNVCHFELSCRDLGSDPDLEVFRAFYRLNRSGSWFTFEVRNKNSCCYSWITTSLKDWKDRFFWVDDRCDPAEMTWRLKRYFLSFASFVAMGVKEALRLKSFYSTEFDVRATRTPKGDPPYLIHLSIEDEGGHAEEGAEGDDGGDEERPQVSLKRRQTTSFKSDPNLKLVKRKKLDFHTITLDDDEVDQVTGFSTAGGLLDNLDAHMHGGRTPKDRPVTLPASPLSFGGPATKVIEDVHMLEPLSFKKIEPSPSGKPTIGVASNVSRPSLQPIDGGDSASSSPLWYKTEAVFLSRELGSGNIGDMDLSRASEKYIPEWSLANKDRIIDALSAKMALFHLGTPSEHAHYRKMSGPELGNALMLNQAQSNSLVVETYKRWVEAESNCRKFEREITNLKNEDNVRSKTKQELSSLRLQVDRLKEQVSEAKEVNKSSKASAAAAYEARDKALQDLETLKLKFGDLEKKLSGAEKKHAAELKEMQTSYDQLLADHHRLINDKDELERARDRAIKSPKATIDEAKGMLTRCDGEMVELYAQVSELMLTKQWFLPDEGFKAAHDLVRSAEEVPGYDEGAQGALNAAIKAFEDFHISVLGKVADLVDKPLSVIKQRSELPIVKEDYEA
ncbi:hypothetical protein Hanom_Chr07g00625431 [Helianthus anomalus]